MKSLLLPIQYYIEGLLFGRRCASCKKGGATLCTACFLAIPPAPPSDSDSIYALYSYSDPLIQHAVWSLKYHHRGALVKTLIEKSDDTLKDSIADILQTGTPQPIIFVPIPQYKKKQNTRGFNHSERIAAWMSHLFPGSTVAPLLCKKVETLPQSHVGKKEERIKNIAQAFSLNENCTIDPATLYVIVDDVTTTGATLCEAFRVFHTVGSSNVIGIALAHGYKQRQ
jgi:ComF family protein